MAETVIESIEKQAVMQKRRKLFEPIDGSRNNSEVKLKKPQVKNNFIQKSQLASSFDEEDF